MPSSSKSKGGVKRERGEEITATSPQLQTSEVPTPTPTMPLLQPPKPVIYIRDDDLTAYSFGMFIPQHAMKPYRISATHELVDALGLSDKYLRMVTPPRMPLASLISRAEEGARHMVAATTTTSSTATGVDVVVASTPNKDEGTKNVNAEEKEKKEEEKKEGKEEGDRVVASIVSAIHHPDFIMNISEHSKFSWEWTPEGSRVPYTGDCPPIEGLLEYSLGVASGSVAGAAYLNAQEADTVINWSGGMHHAKHGECSGFCYINDIVPAIVELLKAHDRVLYIDLDVHHGDGVEEAFITTDRVFTLSIHKFADTFFPGTGSYGDIGIDEGRYCTMNLPIHFDNISDFHYVRVFETALAAVVARFEPDAIVLQCGADSLAGDRVGTFNLTSLGHGRCVELVSKVGLPLLVLGGGGYTVKNVARLWAFETSILCGAPLSPGTTIPYELLPTSGWLFDPALTLHVAETALGYPCGSLISTRQSNLVGTQLATLFNHIAAFAPKIPVHPKHARAAAAMGTVPEAH